MNTVRNVVLGSAFRVSWVSSGATANPISFSVLTGSESLVSSYAGQSSGNGHYYVDALINTPGLWQGRWSAVVGTNSYQTGGWFAAFPQDTDQPGRYITWDDVVNRFVLFGTVAGALKAASHYLHYAEGEIDSRLGAHFTVPFSSNNVTVRDLVIDMVYLRSIRFKGDGYKDLKKEIDERLQRLISGDDVMITNSGTAMSADDTTPAYSTTAGYHPFYAAVGVPDIDLIPDSSQMQAEYDARGY